MALNENGSKLDFGFAFDDMNFSDRVLRIEIEHNGEVEGIQVKTIHISSPILAANSPFFLKLFSNGMKESEKRDATLRIDSSEEVAVMDLLNFMYTNTLSSETSSSLLDVLMAADKFQVSSCMRYCSELLSKLPMTCELALSFLQLPSSVTMADGVQKLTDVAKTYLVARYKDFTKFEEEVLKLPLAGIKAVLSSDDLNVTSEDDVYDFVLKWARVHYPIIEKRRDLLTTQLAFLIRFEYMTYPKLNELLSCNDFDPAYASKVVLDAIFFKAQSPHLPRIPRFVKRAYGYRPVKVLESKFPYPHCIVYLDLKKEECEKLLPTRMVFSEDFHLGGKSFFLLVTRCTPSDNFGLFLGMRGKESDSCSVGYQFSARSKPTEDFSHHKPKCRDTLTARGDCRGYPNFFDVTWSRFIAKDSIYFINGVLYLKVEIRMNP